MERILVTTDKFNGRYVAMKSFDDNTIVGVGDEPEKALKDAESKGCKNPVLLYVPEKDFVHIYSHESTKTVRP
ncbi:MAG: DUF5678 domain-containing protein [Pseudomonadota bacterium]